MTHATWRDVWLSEGLAEYLESRIMNEVYGDRREAMERALGLQALRDELSVRKPADQIAGDRPARARPRGCVQRGAVPERAGCS